MGRYPRLNWAPVRLDGEIVTDPVRPIGVELCDSRNSQDL